MKQINLLTAKKKLKLYPIVLNTIRGNGIKITTCRIKFETNKFLISLDYD